MFEIRNQALINELQDLADEHKQNARILEASVHFLSCPRCGDQPLVLVTDDPYEMRKIVRVGCGCREKIEIIFSFEEVHDMNPFWAIPYYMKFETALRWNRQILEEMGISRENQNESSL